jgi:hypothetical protein
MLRRRGGGRGARGVESVDPGRLCPEGVTVELVLIGLASGRGEGARGTTGRVLGTRTGIGWCVTVGFWAGVEVFPSWDWCGAFLLTGVGPAEIAVAGSCAGA